MRLDYYDPNSKIPSMIQLFGFIEPVLKVLGLIRPHRISLVSSRFRIAEHQRIVARLFLNDPSRANT
jgi:hypothetical protein